MPLKIFKIRHVTINAVLNMPPSSQQTSQIQSNHQMMKSSSYIVSCMRLHILLSCRYRNNATATGDSIHTCAALVVGPTLLTVGFPAADKMLRYTPIIVCHTTSTGYKLVNSIKTTSHSTFLPAAQSTAKWPAVIQCECITKIPSQVAYK